MLDGTQPRPAVPAFGPIAPATPPSRIGADATSAWDACETLDDADRLAVALAHALDRIAAPLARLARAFHALRGWREFGFSSPADFGAEMFQRSGAWLRDMASLGAALARFPRLRDALTGDDGGVPVGCVAATWIGRFVDRAIPRPRNVEGAVLDRVQVEADALLDRWVAYARSVPARDLRLALRRARADGSTEPPVPLAPSAPGASAGPARASGAAADARADAGASGDDRRSVSGPAPAVEGARDARADPGRSPDDESAAVGNPASAGRGSSVQAPGAVDGAFDGVPRSGEPADEVDSPGADDPPAPRRRILIEAPHAVRIAFDEVLDLHRAVSGSDRASVAGFCEALAAESVASGYAPPDPGVEFDRAPRLAREQREREMERIASGWEPLPPVAECVERASRLLPELRRLAWLEDEPPGLDVCVLVSRMEELLALRERLWVLLGGLLAEMSFLPAWSHFGFVDAGHYAEKRLRLRRTTAERRMRLARALRSHARVRRGYERGRLGAESARLLVQALGREPAPETVESAWVRAGMSSTVKYLRDIVVLRKRSATRREGPKPPPDETEWSESLRRGPGRTRTRVQELGDRAASCPVANDAVTVLLTFAESCQLDAALRARREALRRSGEALAAARRAGADGVPRPEELPASLRLAETFSKSLPEVPPWVGLLAMLEDYADTWDDPAGMPRRAEDRAYARDGWRCRAPGCTSRRNLEAHHIHYRSRGGGDDESNLLTLCALHHRQGEHGDLLRVDGEAPLGLSFRLGRGEAAHWFTNERFRVPGADVVPMEALPGGSADARRISVQMPGDRLAGPSHGSPYPDGEASRTGPQSPRA